MERRKKGEGGEKGRPGMKMMTKTKRGGPTCDEVAAHEGLAELLGVAVLAVPQGPTLTVKVLPEMRQRHPQRVLVGVFALELVQDERAGDTGDTQGTVREVTKPQSHPKPPNPAVAPTPPPRVSPLEDPNRPRMNGLGTEGQRGQEDRGDAGDTNMGTISTPRVVTNPQGDPKAPLAMSPGPPGVTSWAGVRRGPWPWARLPGPARTHPGPRRAPAASPPSWGASPSWGAPSPSPSLSGRAPSPSVPGSPQTSWLLPPQEWVYLGFVTQKSPSKLTFFTLSSNQKQTLLKFH